MTRAEALIEASDADETLLLGMIQFKGSRGRRNLLVVEGHDDVTFVDAVLGRFNPAARSSSATYNSKGKQNVLVLFDLVNESLELNSEEYWFFIDADFDGRRGRSHHAQLWMTPTYSFENLLVSAEVLEALLTAEYRCNDVAGAQDLENVRLNYFEHFLSSYKSVLKFPNLCAYFCMKNGIATHSHDNTITRLISVDFPDLTLSISEEEILAAMPKGDALDRAAVEEYAIEFDAMNPLLNWRGKFLYAGFLSFLEELKRDRGSKAPQYFSNRQSMSFNPRTDAVRALTSVASLPESLISFARSIPS